MVCCEQLREWLLIALKNCPPRALKPVTPTVPWLLDVVQYLKELFSQIKLCPPGARRAQGLFMLGTIRDVLDYMAEDNHLIPLTVAMLVSEQLRSLAMVMLLADDEHINAGDSVFDVLIPRLELFTV